MRPAGLAFVAALAAITAPAQAAAQPTEQTFEHAGVTRSYLAYAPSASPARGAHRPVLIVLHGGGGNARQIMRFARFNPIAEREGFVVLYPQGLQHSWNDGRKFSGRNVQRDDVGFILAALDHLEAQGVGIDREAVGVAGISNGGFMAMRLGCEAAGKIAGIATLTATMPAETGARCHPARPVPVLMINGTSDPIVPYEGGYVRLLGRDRGAIWSTGRTVEFWMGVNGCRGEPQARALEDRDPGDGTTTLRHDLRGCRAPVTLLEVRGGGHTWPGGSQYLPDFLVGRVSRDFDASEEIFDFFKSIWPSMPRQERAGK
jgi:polyhydroxybutyrate depolymerase